MTKEKDIENAINDYLLLKGAISEKMQSGEVIIVKGKYKNKMKLQSNGCPDIVCFYRGEYIGIEVKKDQSEVDHWLKQEKRFHNGETIPKSYKREADQIRYKQKILKNGGTHILTYKLSEVIEFIEELDKTKDLQLLKY